MRAPVTRENKIRIFSGFVILSIMILILTFVIAKIQIIDAEEYTNRAISQQTKDMVIEPNRGIIYDRNGKELATTVSCYALWVRPVVIQEKYEEEKIEKLIKNLVEIGKLNKKDLKKILYSDNPLVCVTKYLEKKPADEIRKLNYEGIELMEGTRRFYPLGDFASQLLGSVTDDNVGRTGIELEYDQYLKGVSGRWVKNTDLTGNELVGGTESYHPAQDGYNLVMTLDEAVQYYAEKAIEKAYAKTKAKRIMCLIMDPKTGEVLANAITPGYDPNNPYGIPKASQSEYKKLSNEEKSAYLFKMWKNPIVSDTYEPGSTFKLITASSAIEERAINLNQTFYCQGTFHIADYTLHCTGNHGVQNIKKAVGNSCNPALAEVARLMGKTRMYKYIDLYGITDITGIDYPGEAKAIIQSLDNVGPVELATIGYGQGISLTPIQLLTAANAIGNGGKLMQPRYVKGLADNEGNMVKEFKPTVVRKVISNKTSKIMKDIMEYVVSEAGGGNAKLPGYRVGGKTGTANKVEANGQYGQYYYSSFLGMAPMNDPKVSILVVVDSPKTAIYGSVIAAPIAKEILGDIMRYMNVTPQYSSSEEADAKGGNTVVPNVVGMNFSEAAGVIGGRNLKYDRPDKAKNENFVVVDQYPKAGTKVRKKTVVYLYNE